MTICSLILHTRPENLDPVTVDLESMEGVEVHGRSEHGKLIVVIDHPERRHCSEMMMTMAKMDRVVNTSLVYEYHEPDAKSWCPDEDSDGSANDSVLDQVNSSDTHLADIHPTDIHTQDTTTKEVS
jgi:nitrate reductase NapD